MNTSLREFWVPFVFGNVAAGNLNSAGNGLNNQSTNAIWWSSSLISGTNAFNTWVNSTDINPGTNNNNKSNGFTVSCVFP